MDCSDGIIGYDLLTLDCIFLTFAAKDVFGLIIFGIRDVLSGEDTPLASLAMVTTGVTKNMRRKSHDEGVEHVLAILAALEAEAGGVDQAHPELIKQLVTAVIKDRAAGAKATGGASPVHSGAASPESSREGNSPTESEPNALPSVRDLQPLPLTPGGALRTRRVPASTNHSNFSDGGM